MSRSDGKLDSEVVNRGLGHHVMVVQYGYPAGAVGSALIETGEEWGEAIPPLNALVVNKKYNLPGDGVNWFLDEYYEPEKHTDEMTIEEKRAIVEEIHEDIFSYEYWDELLEEIVFKNNYKYTAVEVKSIKSNDNDLNRGIFQCIKYQALLRAEQKALLIPPTARAILVTEKRLPTSLRNLADILGIKVMVCKINT